MLALLLAPSLFVLGEVVSFCLASWLLAVPVGLVDPWGLSPMSAAEFREYRADVRGRAWGRVGGQLTDIATTVRNIASDPKTGFELVSGLGARVQGLMDTASGLLSDAKDFGGRLWGNLKDGAAKAWEFTKGAASAVVDWTKNNWQYLLAGAVLAGGLLLGGPIGAGIVIGFVVSGGVELGYQAVIHKGDFSKINYKKVANAASAGGLAGGAGAGVGGLVTKSIATPVIQTSSARAASQAAAQGPMGKLASGMFESAVSNGVNGAGSEILENGFSNPNAIVRKGASGLVTGAFTPLGAAGGKAGLNKAFGVEATEVVGNQVTTTISDSFSGGLFAAGYYAISEETSEVKWENAAGEFFKGAASSGLTSGPIKAPVFEGPLKLGAQQVSPGQRVTLSGLSAIAVGANGLAAEEAFKHDEQGK